MNSNENDHHYRPVAVESTCCCSTRNELIDDDCNFNKTVTSNDLIGPFLRPIRLRLVQIARRKGLFSNQRKSSRVPKIRSRNFSFAEHRLSIVIARSRPMRVHGGVDTISPQHMTSAD